MKVVKFYIKRNIYVTKKRIIINRDKFVKIKLYMIIVVCVVCVIWYMLIDCDKFRLDHNKNVNRCIN